MPKGLRYCMFRVDDISDINNIRAALTHKFNDKTLLAWAEKECGVFYVYFTSKNGYVEKNIRNKLICLEDTQEINPCTFYEINQVINSTNVIYKQDNRKHQKNKKLSVPTPTPTPTPTPAPAPAPAPTQTQTHVDVIVYGRPIFFDLDKSDDSNSEEND